MAACADADVDECLMTTNETENILALFALTTQFIDTTYTK